MQIILLDKRDFWNDFSGKVIAETDKEIDLHDILMINGKTYSRRIGR
ncbi:MAG: hypothetical protein PWP27_183 [Clostridiales bacterium]|nr:hypothetical protein [Clostridiales bacterium]